MIKKIFVVLFISFTSIFILSFSVFANNEESFFVDELDDNNSNDSNYISRNDFSDAPDLDYVLENFDDSIEISNDFETNRIDDDEQTRTTYYASIYGFLRWTDDNNVTHALEGAIICTYPNNGNGFFATSDSTGFYSLNFTMDSKWRMDIYFYLCRKFKC